MASFEGDGVARRAADHDARSAERTRYGIIQRALRLARTAWFGCFQKTDRTEHREGVQQTIQSVSTMLADEALVKLAHRRALAIACAQTQ